MLECAGSADARLCWAVVVFGGVRLKETDRTSQSDPLRIAVVDVGPAGGQVGITICPGKSGESALGPRWRRDLDADMACVKAWGAHAVVTLVEDQELVMLGVPKLGAKVVAGGMAWYHLPISDGHPPDGRFMSWWPTVRPSLEAILDDGGKLLVHCRGGLGRAGTIAACLLVERGVAAEDAMARVRAKRPGAIETLSQEAFVQEYKPHRL
jgi:protein-tyrosine phosphatase